MSQLRRHTSGIFKIGTSILKTGFSLIKLGSAVYCINKFVGDITICTGSSMEPTIFNYDVLFTEHLSPMLNRLSNGDIVVARSPADPHRIVCKRIVGTPGDKIRVDFSYITVPEGHVWLEGDNRYNSIDSRTYGPVPQALVLGRAFCRIWPLNAFYVFP